MSILQLAIAQVMMPSWWNIPIESPRPRKEKRYLHRTQEQFNSDRRLKSAMRYKKVMQGKELTVQEIASALHMHIDAARNSINRLSEDGMVCECGSKGRAKLWKWNE